MINGQNMIAGVELIRKKEQKQAFAMTCTLLTNSEGKKMGRTQSWVARLGLTLKDYSVRFLSVLGKRTRC
mgnify:CR=1 FL=1